MIAGIRPPKTDPLFLDVEGVLKVEDWAEIRRLHRAEGVPIKEIARRLRVARNTVKAALASDRPPRYERAPRGSVADGFEPRVRALLREWPRMTAPEIARRIDWPHSLSPLKKLLAQIRPEYVGVDPVDRVVYEPGQLTQCDLWFPEPRIPVAVGQARILPVLVMTLAFSRFLTATMIPSRQAGDILSGMWMLIRGVGRVTRTLLWDRESAIGGTGRVSAPAAAFAGTLATQIRLAPPRDAEFKGMVERNNQFLETSFLPGRTFASPADFNEQLAEWLAHANARTVRSIHGRPVDLLEAEYASMLTLPPVVPPIGLTDRVRLGREYYVRVDTVDSRSTRGRLAGSSTSPPRSTRSPCSVTGRSWPATAARGPSTTWSPTRPTSPPPRSCVRPSPRNDNDVRQPPATTPTVTPSRCGRCRTMTPCSASTSPTHR
jgi:transposase